MNLCVFISAIFALREVSHMVLLETDLDFLCRNVIFLFVIVTREGDVVSWPTWRNFYSDNARGKQGFN